MMRTLVPPLLAAVVATGASAQPARTPDAWPPPDCTAKRFLVDYRRSDGFTFNDHLVIRRDRRASVCFGRRPGNVSGRRNFVLPRATFRALVRNLNRVDFDHLRKPDPPPPPQPADTPTSSLMFRSGIYPLDGEPIGAARRRALARAMAILDGILARRVPPQ
jgi:hypothetical protein